MSTSPAARLLAAACLVVTGIGAVAATALKPAFSDQDRAAIDTAAAHLGRFDGALTAELFVLLLGAATAVAALPARAAFPRLAGPAGWLGIISGSAMVFLVSIDFMVRAAVDTDRDSAVKLMDDLTSTPQFLVFVIVGLIGGLVAMVCLGVGLWRSGAIPRWAAAALIVYQPVNILLADAGQVPWALANVLLLIGFTACAVTIVRDGFPARSSVLTP